MLQIGITESVQEFMEIFSILLGPILLIRDADSTNRWWGWVFTLLLIPGLGAGFVKPKTAGVLASLVSLLIWLGLGALVLGIDC